MEKHPQFLIALTQDDLVVLNSALAVVDAGTLEHYLYDGVICSEEMHDHAQEAIQSQTADLLFGDATGDARRDGSALANEERTHGFGVRPTDEIDNEHPVALLARDYYANCLLGMEDDTEPDVTAIEANWRDLCAVAFAEAVVSTTLARTEA